MRKGEKRTEPTGVTPDSDARPPVAVVVLNWNRSTDTVSCLASLAEVDYPNAELIVVDNASTDGTPDAVRKLYPQVTLLENSTNLGYAEGNNVGIRYALESGADYILLLNNDTFADPQLLRALVEAALAYPDSGVLGPLIYYFNQPNVIWSAGGSIDWRSGRTWMLGLEEDRGQHDSPCEVDFVTGCALFVSAEAVRRAGLLDYRFFTYYEEVEYCSRVRQAGFRILCVPAAKIWHKISPAAQLVSPRINYYMTRNRLLFLRASGAGNLALLRCLSEQAKTLVSWSLRSRHYARRGQRAAVVRGMVDFALGHFGERRALG